MTLPDLPFFATILDSIIGAIIAVVAHAIDLLAILILGPFAALAWLALIFGTAATAHAIFRRLGADPDRWPNWLYIGFVLAIGAFVYWLTW